MLNYVPEEEIKEVDVSGLHLTGATLLIKLEAQVPSLGKGALDLSDKDISDYAKLANYGKVIKVGPWAFNEGRLALDKEEAVGKYVMFAPFSGFTLVYKDQLFKILDDFSIRAVVDDINDIDRSAVLDTF